VSVAGSVPVAAVIVSGEAEICWGMDVVGTTGLFNRNLPETGRVSTQAPQPNRPSAQNTTGTPSRVADDRRMATGMNKTCPALGAPMTGTGKV
jgi:hypothetical protein